LIQLLKFDTSQEKESEKTYHYDIEGTTERICNGTQYKKMAELIQSLLKNTHACQFN
jgi:hypothetical protein